MWGYMGSSGLGVGSMGAGMLIFWVILGLGFAFLVRYAMTDSSDKRKEEKTALEILEERYARGEIGHDEFEEKKHDLER